jgi:hypothetical protein
LSHCYCKSGQKPRFCEILRDSPRFGKKPDFFGARVARNRVFSRIFGDRRRDGKNPGLFGARVARNRVFARYFVTARDSGKNPVSLDFEPQMNIDRNPLGAISTQIIRPRTR